MPYVKMVAGESYQVEVHGKMVRWTQGNPIPDLDIPVATIRALGLEKESVPQYNREGTFTGSVKRFTFLAAKPASKPPQRAEAMDLEEDELVQFEQPSDGAGVDEASAPNPAPPKGGPGRPSKAAVAAAAAAGTTPSSAQE